MDITKKSPFLRFNEEVNPEVPKDGYAYRVEYPKLVAYVAGPISGLSPEESDRRFMLASEYLVAKGYIVINPRTIKLGLNIQEMWNAYMEACRSILGREMPSIMFLLPGWEQSKGAIEERLIAFDARMSIVMLEHDPVFMKLWRNHKIDGLSAIEEMGAY